MSERLTSIHLPGELGGGLADWGRKTPSEMISAIRSYALEEKSKADAILAASDDEFEVRTYVGVHVQRRVEFLQKSTRSRGQA